jgi:hypothetical protein
MRDKSVLDENIPINAAAMSFFMTSSQYYIDCKRLTLLVHPLDL